MKGIYIVLFVILIASRLFGQPENLDKIIQKQDYNYLKPIILNLPTALEDKNSDKSSVQDFSDPTLPSRLQKAVENVLKSRQEGMRQGFNVSVIAPGLGVWTGTAGYSQKDKKIPINKDSLFVIASITKTFTAACILQLEEEGKLSLNDKLSKYLKPTMYIDSNITIKQLLNHSSGIFDYINHSPDFYINLYLVDMDKVWGYQEILDWHLGPPRFKAGAGYEYSNTNYLILAYIIEKVTNSTYSEEINRRFLTPLGLSSTHPGFPEPLNVGYNHGWMDSVFHIFPFRDVTILPHTALYSAALGIGSGLSTAKDLATWARNLWGGNVLKKETIDKMTTFESGFGLGCFINQFYDKLIINHTGSLFGYKSFMGYIKADSVSIAINVNGDSFFYDYGLNQLLTAILDELYNKKGLNINPAVIGTRITDSNNNGILEPGENINLNFILRDYTTTQPIIWENDSCFISTDDNDLTIENIGGVETISGNGYTYPINEYSLKISDKEIQRKTVKLNYNIKSGNNVITTSSTFRLNSEENCVSFDGRSGQVVFAPLSNSLVLYDKFTIELWFKPKSYGQSNSGVIFNYGNIMQLGFNNPNGTLRFYMVNADGTIGLASIPMKKININNWQHIALTYNGNGGITIYLNGKQQQLTLDANNKFSSGIYFSSTNRVFTLGNYGSFGYGSSTFDGLIDNVRIWNKNLTQENILFNMTNKLNGNEDGLLAMWDFNEGHGLTSKDRTSNGNNCEVFANYDEGINPATVFVNDNLNDSNFSLNIQPNPIINELMLGFYLNNTLLVKFNLYDITGKLVECKLNTVFTEGMHKLKLDIKNLQTGTYIYEFLAENKIKRGILYKINE